jgi:WD40 repeat protein
VALALLARAAAAGEPAKLEPLWVLEGHVSLVECVAWSPDGNTLASSGGYTDGAIRFWDPERGEPLRTIQGTRERVARVAFSPDGKLLASGSSDMTITLWDAGTGAKQRVLAGMKGGIHDMAFSPDGTRLAAACSGDDAVGLWDTKDWSLRRTMTIRWGAHSVAFSHDSQFLIGGGRFGSVLVWSGRTGALARTLSYYRRTALGSGKITAVWSPDDKLLATSSDAPAAALRNGRTGATVRTLKPVNTNTPLAFSPDGSRLATASADGVVQFWDVETGVLAARLVGHTARVWALAFAPDGKTLATGSADKTVRLWDLEPAMAKR